MRRLPARAGPTGENKTHAGSIDPLMPSNVHVRQHRLQQLELIGEAERLADHTAYESYIGV